jgi:hypothetical protein
MYFIARQSSGTSAVIPAVALLGAFLQPLAVRAESEHAQ